MQRVQHRQMQFGRTPAPADHALFATTSYHYRSPPLAAGLSKECQMAEQNPVQPGAVAYRTAPTAVGQVHENWNQGLPRRP